MNNHNRGLADMDGELRAQWGQNYCCVNNMGMKKEIDGALFGCIFLAVHIVSTSSCMA